MSLIRRWGLSALMLCLPVVALSAGAVRAADNGPSATEAKAEDALIYKTLRDVINEGADMYNAQGRYKNMDRDYAGCYHLYEGALLVVKPLLSHHAELQKAIDDASASARETPQMEKRAFVLREVIDKIREEVNPKGATVVAPTPPKTPVETTIPVTPMPPVKVTTAKGKVISAEKDKLSLIDPEGKEKTYTVPVTAKVLIDDKEGKLADVKADSAVTVTSLGEVVVKIEAKAPALPKPPPVTTKILWDRLGGEENVSKVVDDFVNTAGKDVEVNFWRDPTRVPSKEEIADLKKALVEFISSATGGPLVYKGKSMKEAHKGMKISEKEFDAAAKDLKDALEKNHAKAEDVDALMKLVEGTRKDVVEDKKPEDKKPEDKKPADKGTVSGKVTFKGKPVTGNTVLLLGKDFKHTIDIGLDGSYKEEGVAPGLYAVAVGENSEKPNPGAVKIPAKYLDPEKSGLTVEVKKGEQVFNIELQD
jgi:truncated hemoglobin YjbI